MFDYLVIIFIFVISLSLKIEAFSSSADKGDYPEGEPKW